MQHLDEEMAKDKKTTRQARKRVLPKQPIMSTFTKIPTGHPIDFYDPDWFNDFLSPAKKVTHVDSENVAFLPDATKSLLPRPHPDKRFSQKNFTAKYWDSAIATAKYDLKHLIVQDDDDGDADEEEEQSDDEGSIDLNDDAVADENGVDEENDEEEEEDEEDTDPDDDNISYIGQDKEEELERKEEARRLLRYQDDEDMEDPDEIERAKRYFDSQARNGVEEWDHSTANWQ